MVPYPFTPTLILAMGISLEHPYPVTYYNHSGVRAGTKARERVKPNTDEHM
jgi:hypothetical protein